MLNLVKKKYIYKNRKSLAFYEQPLFHQSEIWLTFNLSGLSSIGHHATCGVYAELITPITQILIPGGV